MYIFKFCTRLELNVNESFGTGRGKHNPCFRMETGMLNGLSFGRALATCEGEVEGARERIKLFSLLGL